MIIKALLRGNMHKKILLALCTVVLLLMAILAGSEIFLRKYSPPMRIQIFRESPKLKIQQNEHGIFWRAKQDRLFSGCVKKGGQPTIMLQGSSILYSSSTSEEDGFSVRMQEALQHTYPDVCVINQAQSGFTFANQYAAVQGLDTARKAKVILWEVWANSPNQFVKVGSSVYNFGDTDPHFVPDPFAIGQWSRRLLSISRVYEWMLVSRFVPRTKSISMKQRWQQFSMGALQKMQQVARDRDAQLLLAFFPNAHQPFADQRQDDKESYNILAQLAQQQQVSTLFVGEQLEEAKRKQYFADKCCHYSAWGVQEVSTILSRWMLEKTTL